MNILINKERQSEIEEKFGKEYFRVFYLNRNISFKNILHKIAVDFSLKYDLKHIISEKDKTNAEINLFIKNDNQKLITFSAFYIEQQHIVIISVKKVKISGLTSLKLLNTPEIFKTILKTILTQSIEKQIYTHSFNNYYTKNIDKNILNFYFSRKEENEILLAFFELRTAEKNKSQKKQSYYIITDKQQYLLEFDTKYYLENITELSEKTPLKISGNTIIIENRLYTLKTVKPEKFSEAQECSEPEKIITYFAAKNKHYKENSAAEELLKIQIKKHNKAQDKLALRYFFINIEEKSQSEINFIQILKSLSESENFKEIISNFFELWEIKTDEKISIIQLFIGTSDTQEQLQNIYPIFKELKQQYIEKTKNKIDKTILLLTYSEFLIKSKNFTEAESILTEISQKISTKDEYELIEPKEILSKHIENSKILKIKTLELLAQTTESEKKQEYINQSARLQPLNKEKINQLIQHSDSNLSAKATEILDILSKPLQKTNTSISPAYNILPKESIEKTLHHPISKKKKRIYNFQKWLSKIETEDYAKIRQFAEEITEKTRPELYRNIIQVIESMQISYVELFVSKGRKATGITSYEGNPNFIIIGSKHLNKNSEYYLNPAETAFIIASEASHIYFKHTKLSSSDIWRGTADKGMLFADSLINIIPYSGYISKYTKNITSLNALSTFLSKSEKLKSISKALKESKKIDQYYKKIIPVSKKSSEKQKLLAASRIMQYTADRTGIVFSGNLQDSITAIIKTSPIYGTKINSIYETQFIEQIINSSIISDKELSLRISNLFTFYLSDEYKTIRKLLIK